ncbi:MAG: hypothetical protein ABI855_02250 [Bacteroidota bacterium]
MAHVLLDQWVAIELFCRIISEFEPSIKLSDFKNNNLIDNYIKKCSNNPHYYGAIVDKINEKIKPKGSSKAKSSNESNTGDDAIIDDKAKYKYYKEIKDRKRIYYLSLDIDNRRFFSIDSEELETIEHYINYSGIKKIQQHPEWLARTKQRNLEGTRWYLYYYEDYEITNENNKKEIIQCVVRATLFFTEFLKVEINSLDPSTGDKSDYVGTYSTINNEETHLQCLLKTKEQNKKDLHILFSINSHENLRFAIGQYHNVGEKGGTIYSGVVLLDKELAEERGSISPKVFKQNNPNEWKKLPAYVSLFLKDKRSEITTPSGIKNAENLKMWLMDRINLEGTFKETITENKSNFLHNEKDIQIFRRKFHFYYSTSSNSKEEPDSKGVLFWNHTIFDFSSQHEAGRLKTIAKLFNRYKNNIYTDYDVEMFRVHELDPVIIIERRINSKEPLTVSIIAPMPVGYDPIEFGFCFHDDWSKSLRLSPCIISCDPLFEAKEIGPLTNEQALNAQKKWNVGFLNNEAKFAIFQQYKGDPET